MFGEFSIGDDVTDNDLNIIIKNLYQTNFFKDLSVTLSESLLKISVVENPIIQNLIINVIIEGFKNEQHPKIEAFRQETSTSVIASQDDSIVAIASNASLTGFNIPVFDLDNTSEIADFISNWLDLNV